MGGKHRLAARTTALPDGFDPLSAARRADEIVWAKGCRALVAWGISMEVRPGSGDGRFARASNDVRAFFSRLDVDDRVRAWGSGPLPFGGFSFDPDSDDSRVVVPSVVLGRDGERAWMTTIGEQQTRVSGAGAGEDDGARLDARRIG